MYIAKYLTKIYVCLGSKMPHGKKREQKQSEQEKNKKKKVEKNNNKGCLAKEQHACEKR